MKTNGRRLCKRRLCKQCKKPLSTYNPNDVCWCHLVEAGEMEEIVVTPVTLCTSYTNVYTKAKASEGVFHPPGTEEYNDMAFIRSDRMKVRS